MASNQTVEQRLESLAKRLRASAEYAYMPDTDGSDDDGRVEQRILIKVAEIIEAELEYGDYEKEARR